jgi:uncharacterized repeat protein (TIGR01451 family)
MITVTAVDPGPVTATNSACVTADNSDPVAPNNCDSEDTNIDPVPPTFDADLQLTKTDSFDPLQVGSLLGYTLTVTNNGPEDASQVQVIDTLHPSVTFLAAPGCSYDSGTHTVTCLIATLTNGNSAQFNILVGTTLAGTLTNTACVSAPFNSNANTADDCDSEDTIITINPPILTGLSMTKVASSGSVGAGNNITYTLTVFNDGPDISSGHTVIDTIPVEAQFVSASAGCQHDGINPGGTVTCQFGPLGNNSSTNYTIVLKALSDPVNNTACVIADNFDLFAPDNCDTAGTTVTATQVDLQLVKTGSPQIATVGGNVTYTLTISNIGPGTDPSSGSTIVDTLPGQVQFVSASPGCNHVAGVVTCSVGALTFGNSTAVTITAQVVATGTFNNTATVTGNETDPVSGNNTDGETTTANLCTFCDDFEDSILQPAGVWTYTLSIANWSEDGDNLVGVATGKKKFQAVATPIFAGCLNCTVQASMATAGGPANKVWLLAWYLDDKNNVELEMNQPKKKWTLRHRINNKIKKAVFKSPINVGQFYNVSITFNGSAFTVGIDANPSAITMNPGGTVNTGTVGFRVLKTTGRLASINVN